MALGVILIYIFLFLYIYKYILRVRYELSNFFELINLLDFLVSVFVIHKHKALRTPVQAPVFL